MIRGIIDRNLEARFPLEVSNGDKSTQVSFLLDTGFCGHLALTSEIVDSLGLEVATFQRGITADGSVGDFPIVDVEVRWHGRKFVVAAQILGEPLLGTRLLFSNRIEGDWRVGSEVTLTEI